MKNQVSLRDFASSKKRREFLEKHLNIELNNIANFSFTEEQVSGRNIENLIGATQIPLGIAGPLNINKKDYFVPLATTEGALVASISRGCKAVTESGGVNVFVEDVGMTRGPVFKTKNLTHGVQVKKWVEENGKTIAKVCEKTSNHLKLINTTISPVGRNLFIRFQYHTADAMGMNMVTIATEEAVKLIEKKTKAQCIALAGNFDIDKKPAWLNFIQGRGKKIWAEAILNKMVIRDVLKTTPEKIVEVVHTKNHLGSIMSGSLGFNGHFANIIAAIFLATGQDPGHIVEGSLGVTTAEVLDQGDLYFSIYLPSLVVGIVGGGTELPTQQEALKILGVKKVVEIAESLGAATLAGELSLISSLAEGTLATAHQKLGRRK